MSAVGEVRAGQFSQFQIVAATGGEPWLHKSYPNQFAAKELRNKVVGRMTAVVEKAQAQESADRGLKEAAAVNECSGG